MVRPPRSVLRSASAPAQAPWLPRLRASPLRAASIGVAPVRRNRSGRWVGICRLQPRPKTAVASAAAFTRPGRPPLPGCASHSAITGGGKWLRRKRSRQGIRPVTPFAYASPFSMHLFPFFRCGLQRASRRPQGKTLRGGASLITLREKNFLLLSSTVKRLQREMLPIEEETVVGAVCLLQIRSSHPAKAWVCTQ